MSRHATRALLERYGDPDATAAPATAYEVRTLTGGPLDALAERHGLLPMTVTEAHDLTAPGHPRRERFVRVVLPDGTAYRTADHLTVLPLTPRPSSTAPPPHWASTPTPSWTSAPSAPAATVSRSTGP